MADFSRLPGPNADLWDWQLRGLCRGKDSSLFFHPEGERGAARSSRELAAKEICMNCPVQIACADHALKVREPYGVWGGMTEEEREEHHARQKALARAQAAREKEARARQEKLKEKLLREKAMQNQAKERAAGAAVTGAAAAVTGTAAVAGDASIGTANDAVQNGTATDGATCESTGRRKRPVGGSAAVAAPKTKAADTNAPKKAPSKPAARKKTKALVKA